MADTDSNTTGYDVLRETTDETNDEEIVKPKSWLQTPAALLTNVALALLIDYLLLTVIIPVIPSYTEDMGVTGIQVGLLFASKGMTQILANPFWGRLTDNVGSRVPMMVGLILLAASTITYALADAYWLLLTARAVQGIASAALMTAGMAMVAETFRPEKRPAAMSTVMSGVGIGAMLGPSFGGLAFLNTPMGKGFPFYLMAVAIIGIAVLQVVIDASRRAHAREVQAEAGVIAAQPAIGMMNYDSEGRMSTQFEEQKPATLWTLLKDPQITAIFLCVLLVDSCVALLEPLLPPFLIDEHNVPESITGVVFLTAPLSYALSNPFVAKLATKMGRGRSLTIGLLLMAVVLPILAVVKKPLLPIEIVILCLVGVAVAFVNSAAMPCLADIVDHRYPGSYGGVFAISDIAMSVGYVIGPLLGAFLVDKLSFLTSLGIFSGVLVVYAPFFCYFRPERSHFEPLDSVTVDEDFPHEKRYVPPSHKTEVPMPYRPPSPTSTNSDSRASF